MILIKICKKCKKILITRNNNNGKDKKIKKKLTDGKMLCQC